MKYFAKTNTSHPLTGLISAGEVLTDQQTEALGGEIIASLVKRGAVGIVEEAAEEKVKPEETDEKGQGETAEQADTQKEAMDEEDLVISAEDVVGKEPEGSGKPGRRKK